jgi:RHS repeat-associated protein
MGIGYGGSCDNTYVKYGVLDQTTPFTIQIRARLLDEESPPNNHFGFGFGAEVPTAACDFGLGKGLIQDLSNQTFAVDTSVFHDYRAECDPIGASYRLFVDGNLIASNTLPVEAQLNRVLIGDFTCGANAHAEVTQFQVAQNVVASQNPVGGSLVAPASSVDLDLRTGPATARVPDVGGTQESDALRLIAQAGLQTRVVRQHSPTVPLGAVIKTLPLPGSRALPNDPVTVMISLGAPQCVPPPADMRVWFKGEGTSVDAVSGTAASPTSGVSYYSAVVGQGLAFADGYVELPHSGLLEFHGQMTMEAWVRPNAGSGNIFSKSDDAGANGAFLNLFYQASDSFGALSGRLAFTVYAEDGSRYVQLFTPPASVRSGEWVHFAAVDDGSNLILYLNGVQVASGASPPAGTNLGTLVVGAYKRGTGRDGFFGGGVDELSIYGRALTADEITSIYAADIGGKCSSTFNTPPVVNAGPDQVITLPATATLVGTATDDGLPAGSTLACTWSQISGPGAVTFASPTSTNTSVTYPAAGVYDLRLTCTDGLLTTSDDVIVTATSNTPGVNQPPVVNCGPDIKLPYPQNTVAITCTVDDDGLPANGSLSTQWSGEGDGPFQLLNATATSVTVVVSSRGHYKITLTATDGELSTPDNVTIYAVPDNKAPVVNAGPDQTVTLPDPALLAGTVTDDGLPEGAIVSGCWSLVSGPGAVSFGDACSASTTATFALPGTYVLSLEGTDTLLTSHDEVTIDVRPVPVNQAPIVSAGPNQTINLPSTLALAGAVTDDGLPSGGTLTSFWSLVSGPAPVSFNPVNGPTTTVTFTKRGTYVLRLTANDSALQNSADLTVQVYDPVTGPGPNVAIAAPTDGAEVTGLADITGTVTTPNLDNYVLEYRDVDDSTWTQFASGTSAVSSGKLGTLDPTILLNGTYALRLTATDTSGQTASDSITVSLTRNMKVGNFTVSFKDLSVPVAGIPIEVIRTYDSRNKRQGDFGVGWTLDINSLRVQKNRLLAETWETTVEAGGPFGMLQVYCLVPTKRHYVTVTFADGKVFRWEAKVVAPGGGYNGRTECQLGDIFTEATVSFTPLAPTTAALSRQGGTDVIINAAWPGDAELVSASDGSSLFEPDKFVVTLLDGRQLDVAQATGLQRVTDTNGNVLEVKPTGLFHSSGKSVTFARDSAGRITEITDPSGNTLGYSYSAAGDLVSFRDPSANVSKYGYDTKHYLLSIQDPRDIVPIRNEYDDAGRLLSHTDANKQVIAYQHDIVARHEVVTDRLGHSTAYDYDDRGNVLATTDALGGVTSDTYDDSDNKLTEANALGQMTQYAYDANDNKISETDPLGNVTLYTYDDHGNVLTVTDPLGRVTQNAYDASGNLIKTTDPAGNVTLHEYNSQGLQTKTTDALGNVTTYAYDTNGNLTQEVDPVGRTTSYTYDPNGNRLTQNTTRTTAAGPETLTTSYTYDASGRVVSTLNPDGSGTTTEYNSIGQQSATTDALGHRMTRAYDDLGRLVTTTYADGTTETTTYDAEGHRIASTDRAGRASTFDYDAVGRLLKSTFPDASFTSTTYDAAGRTTATTDELGKSTTYEYDADGRRSRVIDPLHNASTFTYDAAGNQLTLTDALGHITTYGYDLLNRRVSVLYADATQELTEYDVLGRRTAKVDQAGIRTEYTYDATGRLVGVKDALNGVTTYAYDEQGSQVSQTDALGRVTRFDYDKMGRRIQRTLPLGVHESMTYDLGGNLLGKTDFMGRNTTFAYDLNNRLVQKLFADGSGVAFTYTPVGRRATAVDARGTTQYSYDARDRVLAMTYPDGRKLQYTYDARGNRNSISAVLGTSALATSYMYNDAGQLATVTDPNGAVTTYSYDANGARKALNQPNGTVTAYTYDAVNHLKSLTTVQSASNTTIQGYVYTLGPTGIRQRIDEANGTSRAYGYDKFYRLTHEAITGSGSTDYTKDFTYDAVGNRLTQGTTGFNAANVNYTYDDRDRLLTENATSYGWDNNGNLTSKSGDSQYTWDYEDHLIRITKADGTIIDHTYDADGVRVQTKVTPAGGGGAQVTNYLVDTAGALSHVVAETDANGAITAYYVRGGDQLLEVIRGVDTRYYHEDGLGSVRVLTDANGVVTDDYGYTAFGEALGWTGSDLQPYRFAGEETSFNVALQYNRARWYCGNVGQFVAADPLEGAHENGKSLNHYAYGEDDPLNRVDPSGKMSITEVAVTAEILATISVVSYRHVPAVRTLVRSLGPFDDTTEQSMRLLHPEIRILAWIHMGKMIRAGLNPRIVSSLRTYEEQQRLYDQGRSTPGRIVTNARPGRSLHNFALAYDIELLDDRGRATWSNRLFETAGGLGEDSGLTWGGRFTSLVDRPHFQYTNGASLCDIRRRYESGCDVLSSDADNGGDSDWIYAWLP